MITMRKISSDDDKRGGANWMDTYGDMVTLLLTFFVMLYSFSTLDTAKMEQFLTSFQSNVGILYNGGSHIGDNGISGSSPVADEPGTGGENSSGIQNGGDSHSDMIIGLDVESMKNFKMLYTQVKQYVTDNNLSDKIEVVGSNDEIKIRFLDNVLFRSGRADVSSQAESVLNQVAGMFNAYDGYINRIGIEGHTDSLPINTGVFESNWELSALRAVKVARYMIEKCNIPPQKVTAEGYGEYHPIGDNSNEDGRSKNRRVEIVITRAAVL